MSRTRFPDVPDAISDVPDAISNVPDAIPDVPDAISDVPDAISDVPDAISDVPDAFPGRPVCWAPPANVDSVEQRLGGRTSHRVLHEGRYGASAAARSRDA